MSVLLIATQTPASSSADEDARSTEGLLRDIKASQALYKQYDGILKSASRAEQAGNIGEFCAIIQQGFRKLPTPYHLRLHIYLAIVKTPDAETEYRYIEQRRASISTLLKEGTPEQKAKATFWLAKSYADFRLSTVYLSGLCDGYEYDNERPLEETAFFKPTKALKIYAALCEDRAFFDLSYLKPDDVFYDIGVLLGIGENDEQSRTFYEQILAKKATAHPVIFEKALEALIALFTSNGSQKDYKRGCEMAEEALKTETLSKNMYREIESHLILMYRLGPSEIRDHRKVLPLLVGRLETDTVGSDDYLMDLFALSSTFLPEVLPILEVQLKNAPRDTPYYFNVLHALAVFCSSNHPARDIERAISLYEELSTSEKHKISSLERLSLIYSCIEGYTDPEKVSRYRAELNLLYKEK